jgi:hypothetical protein
MLAITYYLLSLITDQLRCRLLPPIADVGCCLLPPMSAIVADVGYCRRCRLLLRMSAAFADVGC